MRPIPVILLFIALLTIPGCSGKQSENSSQQSGTVLQNGDIIFQISQSGQSRAIQLATDSKYSHMGIIYKKDGRLLVYEAANTVKLTPLKDWIKRGKNRYHVVKRLKNADKVLTRKTLSELKEAGKKYRGKPYDLYFEWSDERIYCSELVWKMYKEATGIKIGKLQELQDFDLSHEVVQKKMQERYGAQIPTDEKVISPAAMFRSDKLEVVRED